MVHEPNEKNITKWLKKYDSNVIMFHHRNPSSTINVKRACHPFSTRDYFGKTEYVLIHNGYISNADELWVEHSKDGIPYQSWLEDLTFNDSEALLWDFALYMEGEQHDIRARGGIAFICMKIVDGKLTNLYFDRNTNPLFMKRKKDKLYLASEGKGQAITPGLLYNYDYAKDTITTTKLELPNRYDAYLSNKTSGATPNSGFPSSAPSYPYDEYDEDNELMYHPGPKVLPAATKVQPTPVKAGSWLGEALRKKFNVTTATEYVESEGGIMVPVDTQIITPKPVKSDEPEEMVLKYLVENCGVFERAYWSLEYDYMDLNTKRETTMRNDKIKVMERAMDIMSHDEEYVNEKSVSSIWKALWKSEQRKLAV